MATEAQKRATKKYDQINTSSVALKFNNKTDSDILEFLAKCENRQGTIKKILREYLENHS